MFQKYDWYVNFHASYATLLARILQTHTFRRNTTFMAFFFTFPTLSSKL